MAVVAAAAQPAVAKETQTSIDYSSFTGGIDAPPGAMARMRRAAQLAARGAHCGNVSSGTYLPPKYQLPDHKNEPYMVTCKANDSNDYYNVYFADSDLKAAQARDRMEAVSPEYARSTCVKVLEKKFPTANLDTSNTRYDASKVTSNVLQQIVLTVENQFGVRMRRMGNCIITPNGRLGMEDVWLTDRESNQFG